MSRTARFQMRLEDAVKAKWQAVAAAEGLDLSAWIEKTIEASLEIGPARQAREDLASEISAIGRPPLGGSEPAALQTSETSEASEGVDSRPSDVLLSPPEVGSRLGDSPRGKTTSPSCCPREAHHRKGLWCKSCGKLIK